MNLFGNTYTCIAISLQTSSMAPYLHLWGICRPSNICKYHAITVFLVSYSYKYHLQCQLNSFPIADASFVLLFLWVFIYIFY